MSGTLEDLKDVMMDMALWIKFNAWLTFISLVVFFLFAQAFTEHIRPVANTSDDTNLWRYINSIIIFRTIGSIDPEG